MPSGRKRCLDNPSLPHKIYRDTLAQRRRQDAAAAAEKLTPALRDAWASYKVNGQELSATGAIALKKELGLMLVAALDGDLDLDSVSCPSCSHSLNEKERRRKCEADQKVSVRPCLCTRATDATAFLRRTLSCTAIVPTATSCTVFCRNT